jgi:arylsulfatase A
MRFRPELAETLRDNNTVIMHIVFRAIVYSLLLAFHVHAASPPNVLLVLADDLGYGDLACYGHPEIKTPHLDRLAAEGLRLTSFYAAGTNCSPARAGMMTGRTPHRAGIYNQLVMLGPMHLRQTEITISSLLTQAGYATAQVGKWHLNGMYNLPGQPQPNNHGFEYWFGVHNNALPNHHTPYNFVRNGIPLGPLRGYSAQIVADEAVDWLRTIRDQTKPFFLYVAFNEPHETIATDPRFKALYIEKHRNDATPADYRGPLAPDYFGNVTQMDDALGRILQALDDHNLARDTLVWFMSDNGPTRTTRHGSTGGFRGLKGELYEGGIRVPGIIRWPDVIKPGIVSSEPVGGVDVLPTLCELAAIAPPSDRTLDGTSIASLLHGGALQRTKPLYWQFIWSGSKPQVALRQGKWKLLAALEGPRPGEGKRSTDITQDQMTYLKTAALTGFELYDLEQDPRETTDVSRAQPTVLAELKAKLETAHASVRADSPVWPVFTDPRYEPPRHIRPDYSLNSAAIETTPRPK